MIGKQIYGATTGEAKSSQLYENVLRWEFQTNCLFLSFVLIGEHLATQTEFNQRDSRHSHVSLTDEIDGRVDGGIQEHKNVRPAYDIALSSNRCIGGDHRYQNHKWHADTKSQGTQHVTQRPQDFFLPSEGSQRNIVGIFCGDLSAVATNSFINGHLHRYGKQDEETAACNLQIVSRERENLQIQKNGNSDPREPCDGDCSERFSLRRSCSEQQWGGHSFVTIPTHEAELAKRRNQNASLI